MTYYITGRKGILAATSTGVPPAHAWGALAILFFPLCRWLWPQVSTRAPRYFLILMSGSQSPGIWFHWSGIGPGGFNMQPESRATGCNQSWHVTAIYHAVLRACRQPESSESPRTAYTRCYEGAPNCCLCQCALEISVYFRKLAVGWLCSLLILGYLPSEPLSTLHRSLFSFKRKGNHKIRAWYSEIMSKETTYNLGENWSQEWIRWKSLMVRCSEWQGTKKSEPWSTFSCWRQGEDWPLLAGRYLASSLSVTHFPYQ